MDLTWKNAHDLPEYILLPQCKDGYLYSIASRNATLGIYREKDLWFDIRREKGNGIFRYVEYHWDVGTVKPEEADFGTAKPLIEIERAPEFATELEFIEYMEKKFDLLSKE
jgi:hypothetical protein